MPSFTRRTSIKLGTGAVAAAVVARGEAARGQIEAADVSPPDLPIEPGAALRMLRPAKFVQGDEAPFLENTGRFTAQTGVPVRVEAEGWEALRPKIAVAADIGDGPDIALAFNEDPLLYAGKLLDLTEVPTYLGAKYGGWYRVAELYGTGGEGRWIGLPIAGGSPIIVYRKSWVEKAGFEGVTRDLDGFLRLCRALRAKGHPSGMALGDAVGDSVWTQWLLWAFGSALVDEDDRVIIDSDEMVEALEYARELYATFISGTLSWLDPSNNKAFLAGEIGLTANGISIYYAAKTSPDPALRAMAADIHHELYPIGPIGRPTQAGQITNAMVSAYTRYPNAARQYLRVMMEREQYVPWQRASIGYQDQTLRAYEANPIWTAGPKHTPYRDSVKNMLWNGFRGTPGAASAAAHGEFVIPHMIAAVCSGQAKPREAAAEAQRRAERHSRR